MTDNLETIRQRIADLEEWTRKDEDVIYERIKSLEIWISNLSFLVNRLSEPVKYPAKDHHNDRG